MIESIEDKGKILPRWSGKKFERWKNKIETWSVNKKSTEEDKYVDLLYSLKKKATMKGYLNKSLIDKGGENSNVKRVLDVMTGKYSKT